MSDLAEQIVSAVTDAGDLWPHNHDLIHDPLIERAILDAPIGSVTSDEELYGVMPHPRLILCDPDVVAYSLIEALTMNVLWNMHEPCDRCRKQVQPGARLWVPFGASVVEIHCCLDCAAELQHKYPNVVWR